MHSKKRRGGIKKFFIILLIVLGYFAFSVAQYGVEDGVLVTALTWAFFVFCTPIADAAILLDFPIRLVTGIKMAYAEILVWGLAIIFTAVAFVVSPEIYTTTPLLVLFYDILTTPWPLWGIIIFSVIGTYFSIYLGDDVLDITTNPNHAAVYRRKKSHILIAVVALGLSIIGYAAVIATTQTFIPFNFIY